MNKELEDVLGNDRLPERSLLKYIYDPANQTVVIEFKSNRDWEINKINKVVLHFWGVKDYQFTFPRPQGQEWANINANHFNDDDFISWIPLDKTIIEDNICKISFHSQFGDRNFTFEKYDIQEMKQ